MPRFYNRKIEIRFDDSSLIKIDNAAKACGLSRAEYIRSSALANYNANISLEAPSRSTKTILTPDKYLLLVQHVYRLLGGSISRSMAEVCVAAILLKLYNE